MALFYKVVAAKAAATKKDDKKDPVQVLLGVCRHLGGISKDGKKMNRGWRRPDSAARACREIARIMAEQLAAWYAANRCGGDVATRLRTGVAATSSIDESAVAIALLNVMVSALPGAATVRLECRDDFQDLFLEIMEIVREGRFTSIIEGLGEE